MRRPTSILLAALTLALGLSALTTVGPLSAAPADAAVQKSLEGGGGGGSTAGAGIASAASSPAGASRRSPRSPAAS